MTQTSKFDELLSIEQKLNELQRYDINEHDWMLEKNDAGRFVEFESVRQLLKLSLKDTQKQTTAISWTYVPNIPNCDRAEKYITEASSLGSSVGANPKGFCPKCNIPFQMTNDNYNKNNENWKKCCSKCNVLLVIFND